MIWAPDYFFTAFVISVPCLQFLLQPILNAYGLGCLPILDLHLCWFIWKKACQTIFSSLAFFKNLFLEKKKSFRACPYFDR